MSKWDQTMVRGDQIKVNNLKIKPYLSFCQRLQMVDARQQVVESTVHNVTVIV